ncbi:MAG: FHA domain-containing protein [Lachnospiraceae bacterium]|nr:FHA domain-containing protein [Lachnospiraceae bacterium]
MEYAHSLIVIEGFAIKTYYLEEKSVWEIGRLNSEAVPDIALHTPTVSRRHGVLRNMDGVWYYKDHNGKNGTFYNGRHLDGRKRSFTEVKNGDVFIFGTAKAPVIDHQTVWAMFSDFCFEEWRIADTKDYSRFLFRSSLETREYRYPEKGLVVSMKEGLGIYMGDITFVSEGMELIPGK